MNESEPILPQRRTLRLPDFDYSAAGAYFVTVCSYHRALSFNDEGVWSMMKDVWEELPAHFSHVRTDAFVVMPNHVHGVLFITGRRARHASPLPERPPHPPGTGGPGPAAGSLGVIVGSFKSAVARRINGLLATPGAQIWQRNYYEHVFRDEEKLNVIRRYIEENPLRWSEDVYNPDRVIKGKP
ncbi:MAG: transposase [Dehalococcoidia bacterium]|nr:transposase [Dehalococcoidia bacterium]